MKQPKWFVTVVSCGVALAVMWSGAAYLTHAEPPASSDSEEHDAHDEEGEPESPIRISRDAAGRPVLELNQEVQTRIGLTCAPVSAARLSPAVGAYGRLEADPSAAFTLRSPVAGFLRTAPGSTWPSPGTVVQAGAAIGAIEPRLSPVERYDLTARLAQARSEVDETSADLAAARSSYESKLELNRTQKIVADRALEEARAKVQSDEARLSAAQETVRLLEGAMGAARDLTGAIAVSVERDGQAVDVLVQPGEAVESGEALMRVVDFRRLIARVALPPGTVPDGLPSTARVEVVGGPSLVLPGTVLTTSTAGPDVGMTFLVAVTPADEVVRPGLAVVAHLEMPGEPMSGVVVPRSAVIRYGGSAYVYVRSAADSFARQKIELQEPLEYGWFVKDGLSADDSVVVTAAGSLLSEELRGQIEAEAEGEE